MANGVDIWGAIQQLLPGYQAGEMVGGQGIGNVPILGNITQALSLLIPGQQSWLGEQPAGYFPENLAGAGPGLTSQSIVKSWVAAGTVFYMFQNGMIGCFKKDGRFKAWRPKKHIVVPRNPKIGTLLKAHNRVNCLVDRLDRQADDTRRRFARKYRSKRRAKACA